MLQGESEYSAEGRIFHGLLPSVMGSKLDLMAIGLEKEAAEAMWKAVCDDCAATEAILNGDDPDSEAGRFNAGKMLAHTSVSDTLGEAVDLCKDYLSETEGLFDPALGKMRLVDHDEEDGSLSVYGIRLQFGSFARGWVLRKCSARLSEAGAGCAFVNLGNHSFLAVGSHPFAESWKVSLTNPFTRMPLEEKSLKDCAMCISCNAPGVVGRVTDPRTGKGVEDRKMAVVTGPDPLEAKVLATAAMVASPGEAERLRAAFPGSKIEIYNL